MTTIKRAGKRIDEIKDRRIPAKTKHGIRYYDLGELTLMQFLNYCLTRKGCQRACVNNVYYYLTKGDPSTEKQFEEYRANHKFRIEDAIAGEVYAHSGDYVDVGRYMAGEPECMIDYVGDQPVKYLTVRVRVAAMSGNYFAYYANICDLVDYLESKGTRCKIVAQMNHGNWDDNSNPERALADVVVKDFAEEFSLRTFCAVFFHAEFSALIYSCAVSISSNKRVIGIDSLYNDEFGDPKGFQQSPDTNEWIVFPSLWFDTYSRQYESIDPMPFYQQIGIAHLID